MSDTTKTSDAVIQKRRADDWKRPSSVPSQDVFNWRDGENVAFIDDKGYARIGAALSGARAITAILMQHDLDRNNDEGQEPGLRLGEITTHGLFEALASCLELAEIHATSGSSTWTTTAAADDPEAEHMRKAAMDARVRQDDRSAAARVKMRAEQAARAAGRGAA